MSTPLGVQHVEGLMGVGGPCRRLKDYMFSGLRPNCAVGTPMDLRGVRPQSSKRARLQTSEKWKFGDSKV
jgi:hypothetical protein